MYHQPFLEDSDVVVIDRFVGDDPSGQSAELCTIKFLQERIFRIDGLDVVSDDGFEGRAKSLHLTCLRACLCFRKRRHDHVEGVVVDVGRP